ncbi:hypothetical protein DYB31_012511 [Aphanomyces astaci]|uniref:NAD(+) ADP-ribosyltransferase n=1 Tax=Aphanomyces astaci TaxID=112090 RepID=A0A397FBY4_APHAT|nr:hypothetical protein DYB31_012511 [Aphanomyces astaci]
MAVTTRSMSSRPTRATAKPLRSTTCPCIWCLTWKPRKMYRRRRRSVKMTSKHESAPALFMPTSTKKLSKGRKPAARRAKFPLASNSTPATRGQVDAEAIKLCAGLALSSPCVATTPSGDYMDASLVLVDLAQNMDKFYILQVIQGMGSLFASPVYYSFTRWGRTGTLGQTQMEGPFPTLIEAQGLFEAKFRDKTAQAWANRASFAQLDGKYDLLRVDYEADASGQWEYYMDNFVDGKATGWYPYTAEGTTQTELLWQTHQANSAYNRRIVQSGFYSYCIDLDEMTQTNISTTKQRRIRRHH